MYTVVKNKLADVPTSQEHHASNPELQVTLPRFDKVLQGITEGKRKRNNGYSQSRIPNRRIKSYFETPDFKVGYARDYTPNRLNPSIKYEGSPGVDTSAAK